MLSDLLPTTEEIDAVLAQVLTPDLFVERSQGLMDGSDAWRAIETGDADTYEWDRESTYIVEATPFVDAQGEEVVSLQGARALMFLGDFVTTDHISPAGSIARDSQAGSYLLGRGVAQEDFNTYGARRGNHEVMMRGTFANVKLQNALAEGRKGAWTRSMLTGEVVPTLDAVFGSQNPEGAEKVGGYVGAEAPLIVVAGKMYGSGSSRDWAAKGPRLLAIQAVIAESFERIHRSNLVQMGIVPLEFADGQNASTLGLDGTETYDFDAIDVSGGLPASRTCGVRATRADGSVVEFTCIVRVDTPTEGAFLASGGILPYMLDHLA